MKHKNNNSGFTLLEILLVIGLIAALAVIVVVALNPAQRFEDARNSRRLSDIESILSAVQQYMVDHKGELPANITSSERQIGAAGSSCDIGNGICSAMTPSCADLASDLSAYLKELPVDPQNGDSQRTHYSIQIDSNNIVTVKACDSTDATISAVSR